jgi:AraC-like DNA-binding protein
MSLLYRKSAIGKSCPVCRYGPNLFCSFLKSQQKQSFISYVKEFRIGYASRLLKETNLSIKEISYESGFDNLANFYRQFKEINRITPSRQFLTGRKISR